MNRPADPNANAATHSTQVSPVSRIAKVFAKLQGERREALIPYVTAGFPYDPSADGAVIQKAGDKALAAGIGLAQVIDMVRVFRRKDEVTPVVLMGYANPVERYDQRQGSATDNGASAFVRDAASAGVDGLLIVDYPPEECVAFAQDLRQNGMDLIFLLAPTSTERRMAQVAAVASGYVYYVSLKGTRRAVGLCRGPQCRCRGHRQSHHPADR